MAKSLSSIIHEVDNGQPVMLVTERIVGIVLDEHREIAEKMLKPLVWDEIRRRRRQIARAAEDDAFGPQDAQGHHGDESPQDHAQDVPASPLDALRAVARQGFWCPLDRTRVLWGEATVEQHKSRAAWQRDRSASLAEDAERHEEAIRMIAGTPGATCLNDILFVSGPQET